MSIFLIYAEIPETNIDVFVPPELASFRVQIKAFRKQEFHIGLAITDGVASDRFLCYGRNTKALEGGGLRKALVGFIKERLGHDVRIFLCFKIFSGEVDNVIVNFKSARQCKITQLTRTLKTVELGSVLEIVL